VGKGKECARGEKKGDGKGRKNGGQTSTDLTYTPPTSHVLATSVNRSSLLLGHTEYE